MVNDDDTKRVPRLSLVNDEGERIARLDAEVAARNASLPVARPMEWEQRVLDIKQAYAAGAADERARCLHIARTIATVLPAEPSPDSLSARAAVLHIVGMIEGA